MSQRSTERPSTTSDSLSSLETGPQAPSAASGRIRTIDVLGQSQPLNNSAIGSECLQHSPGPALLVISFHRHVPNQRQWTSPSNSYYACRTYLATTLRKLWKSKLSYSQVLESTTAHPAPPRKVESREGNNMDLQSCLYCRLRVGCLRF